MKHEQEQIKSMEDTVEEFAEILRQLNDHDLAALKVLLSVENPPPIRDLRSNLSGDLSNAYSARVIVSNPLAQVQNEIMARGNF
jgi:hypothetical protein